MSEGYSQQEAARLLYYRRRARESFLDWCNLVLAEDKMAPARHHRLLIDELEAVERGDTDRLMVQMPPGYAKSTYSSVLFPAYFMSKHKKASLIMASAGFKLATDFSGKVIKLLKDYQQVLGIGPENDNKELFYTTNGCRYIAAGVGSDVAGSRSDLTVIDDPFGGRTDAESQARRDEVYDWYRGNVIGRQRPGGRILLIMTRWHEDDLAGRLLADNPGRWRVLKLPEIAEEDDPLGRKVGEVLWPEWFSEKMVLARKAETGEREHAAQYQQRPTPAKGALFEKDKIRKIVPAHYVGRRVRSWDLAATEKIGARNPDWTVGVRMLETPDGRIVIEDVKRDRGGPQKIEQLILDTAKEDGKDVDIILPQDPGQAGAAQVAYLARMLRGYRVIAQRPTGSKMLRATPVSSQVNLGNVMMFIAPWNTAFIEELGVFPSGTFDDQVDAFSDGYNALVAPKRSRKGKVQKLGY